MKAGKLYNAGPGNIPSATYLKNFIEWKSMSDGEEKEKRSLQMQKVTERFKESKDFENWFDFAQYFYDELTSEILSSPELKSDTVFYRGIHLFSEEKYNEFLNQKTMRSDKFDSFTTCASIAYRYSFPSSNYPVVIVAYFPKGSHLYKVGKRKTYTLYEKLTPPGSVYEIIDYEVYQIRKKRDVFPVKLTVVLMRLIEENGEEMGEIENYDSKQLSNLRRLITKGKINDGKKYFSIEIEDLAFDGSREDFTKIFENLSENKNLKYESKDKLIFDDIKNSCLQNLDSGKYVYPNVIFELDKKLDLELEFPLGYSFDYSIEKNKVGRKYYMIKISE